MFFKNKKKNKYNYILLFILSLILIIYLYLVYFNLIYTIKNNDLNKININKYNKNKKICLLISGQIRDNFYKTFLYQKYFIIDPLNTDIFCVFSDDISLQKKRYIENIINPKSMLWIKDKKNNNIYNKQNTKLLWEKIKLSNMLKIDYEKKNNFKYDVCIKIRPDLFVKNFIDQDLINNTENNVFYSPILYKYQFSVHTNDQIFICNSELINKICNINPLKYKCDQPETILKIYLVQNNIKIKYFVFQYIIEKYMNKSNNPFNIYNLIKFTYLKKKFIYRSLICNINYKI